MPEAAHILNSAGSERVWLSRSEYRWLMTPPKPEAASLPDCVTFSSWALSLVIGEV